ncbi:C-type mannose receptor 2-like [Periplaneta americana]|uniref:C-type mannose receptor 2-like n=1 Tax=Periplaneta americana TaxID=6978 RepID=UPI0037E87B62
MVIFTVITSFSTSQEILEKHNFSVHGREFIIFNRKLSWSSAAKTCEAESGHLADIPNIETLESVSKGMRNSWESLISLWIGGYRAYGNVWQWLSSNTSLSNVTNPLTNYPPWNENVTPDGGDCVSIERGVDGKEKFVQKDCEYSQAFVCIIDEPAAVPVVSVVVIGDRNFTIHEKPETWDKATDICKQEDGHLAVLRDIDEVFYFNSTSNVRRLWIGGRFVKGTWQWLQFGEKIPMELDDEGFPPWNPVSRRPKNKADCLLLDMHKTNDIRFTAATCNAALSFICEKILKIQDKRVHDGRAYIVYNERVPWLEAAALCRSSGYHLALASDLVQSRFLASLTREYYELWLGGVLRDGIWEWEHTGEEIPSTPERNGYPPWISVPTLPDHNCLAINRGGSGAPVFVDTQCDIAQRFICETGTVDTTFLLEPIAIEYESRVYTFYPQRMTWREAAEECQEVGASLVTLTNTDMARFIADKSHNIPDVWIGGHIVDNEWHWISSGEVIPPRKEGREFPPWARPKRRGGHDCLILNSHNPNRPILVDLPCNRTQPFVCEKADNNTMKLVETVKLPDRELIFIESQENFKNAMKVCQSLNGYLATINNAELTEVVDNHGKKFGGVWVGAQKDSNSITRWMHTGQPIADIGMRSMIMWDEDNEIQVGNDYKTNERTFGILADIPDFVTEAPIWSHNRPKLSQQESETHRNVLTEDIAEIKISKPSNMLSHKPPTIQPYFVAPKLLPEEIGKLSKENVSNIIYARNFEQTPIESSTFFAQVSFEGKLASIERNTTSASDIFSLCTSETLESEQLNVENEEKAGTQIPSLGYSFDYITPLSTTESIKIETTTTLQTEMLATACMKLDSKGELVEMHCNTMQSFVCERRFSKRVPIFGGKVYKILG